MKKLALHMDALVVIVLVFATSFGFNLYQRYQYSDLLKEHIGLQFQVLTMELGVAVKDAKLNKCMDDTETQLASLNECRLNVQ
jgi:hypothetical protein